MADPDLGDIVTPAKFERDHPDFFTGKGTPSMEYLIRTRHTNGLADCGAVVEPVKRRPLIVVPKFVGWVLSRKNAA